MAFVFHLVHTCCHDAWCSASLLSWLSLLDTEYDVVPLFHRITSCEGPGDIWVVVVILDDENGWFRRVLSSSGEVVLQVLLT